LSIADLIVTIEHIPNHVERALANIESQFDRSPNLRTLARLLIGQVQDFEDAVWSTYADRMLDAAEGAQLDLYGKVLGASRIGLGDARYRQILKARLLGNLSSGEVKRLLLIWSILQDTDAIDVAEYHPNTLIFTSMRDKPLTAEEQRRTGQWMRAVKKGGVSLAMVDAPTDYFGFEADPDAEGFGDGTFAEVI